MCARPMMQTPAVAVSYMFLAFVDQRVCIVMWRLSVYLHMFTMYGDYLKMWLLHNIKTMQIYL